MSTRTIRHAAVTILGAFLFMSAANAQTIPMHSGHLSHGAPQMRTDGSGLHYPNRPQYHHHRGFAGYKAPNAAAPNSWEAYEANAGL